MHLDPELHRETEILSQPVPAWRPQVAHGDSHPRLPNDSSRRLRVSMGSLLYLNNPLDLRPPVLGRAGHAPQVRGHLNLAAALDVTAEDEDLAFQVRLCHLHMSATAFRRRQATARLFEPLKDEIVRFRDAGRVPIGETADHEDCVKPRAAPPTRRPSAARLRNDWMPYMVLTLPPMLWYHTGLFRHRASSISGS